MTDKKRFTELAGIASMVITCLVVSAFASAWAAFELWHWFVAPIFGITFTYAQAFGLMFTIGYLTKDINTSSEHSQIKQAAISILKPLMVVGFGAIIHYFTY